MRALSEQRPLQRVRETFDERKKQFEIMAKERPYALMMIQTQILYDIAGMLEEQGKELHDLRTEFLSTIPEGKFRPYEVNVNDNVTSLSSTNTPILPCFSCVIINDGPDEVYFIVNENEFVKQQAPLNPGEHHIVDMGKAQINNILFQCKPSETTSLRLYALK